MNTGKLNEYGRGLLSDWKGFFRTNLNGTHGAALIIYLFLVLSVEVVLAWKGFTLVLLFLLGCILAAVVFICPIMLKKAAPLTIKLQKREMGRGESIVWVSAFFAVSFGVLLCWYLSFYPGAFSSNEFYQYKQALSGEYNDWKPILQTLITFTLPLKLTGKPESIVLFQIIEFSGVLAYMSYIMLRYSGRVAAVLALSYILLNPVTGNILIHPWKDVTFAMFAVLLMTFGFQIYVTNGEWLNSKKSVILLGFVLTITTVVRHNGFLFTIPFLIAVFLHISKKRRLQVFLIFLICTGMIKGPVNYSLEVDESWSPSTRLLGAPMSVLGNIAKEAPETFDDATAEFVFSVASKEEWNNLYRCGDFEYLRWNSNLDVIEEAGVGKVLWMAAKASLKAPVPAAKALFTLTDMVYTVNGDLDWGIWPVMAGNAYGLEMRDLFNADGLNSYISLSRTGVLKYLFWYVGVINLIVVISLLSKCRFRVKRDWGKAAFALPLLCYNFGTMFLLAYSNFRYFYLNFPICAIITLILFGEKAEGAKVECQQTDGQNTEDQDAEGQNIAEQKAERISVNAILGKAASLLKSNREIAAFTFVVSGTIIVGGKLNCWGAPYVSSFLFTDLIRLVFYWLLLFLIGRAFIKMAGRRLTGIQAAVSQRKQKKWWVGGFVLLVLLWLPYLLAYYPGILSPDSITSLLQAKDLSILYNHVPIAYTLTVAFFAGFGWTAGDLNFGVAVFSFAQLIMMAAVLSYSVYWIRTRISRNRLVSAGLLLFYGLNPIVAQYSITMWKDVLFSGWIVLFCLFLGDVAISEGKVLTERKGIRQLCILFFLVSFGRNNGIYVVVLSWIMISVLYKKSRKRVLAIGGGVILLTVLIQGPGYKKLGIDQSGFAESVGIPIQQISYTVIHDEGFEKEDLEFLEEIIPIQTIKESYSPVSADNIKFNSEFNTAFFEENKAGFIKLYLKWLPAHFTSYVKSYLLSTEGFWHMEPFSIGWIISDGVCGNELGVYGVDCLKGCFGIDLKQTMIDTLESVRTLPITDAGLLIWLVFFYVLVCFVQKQPWKALVVLPMLGCWLTIMIATPVSAQFRYVYYYYLMLPIVCILIFVKKAGSRG